MFFTSNLNRYLDWLILQAPMSWISRISEFHKWCVSSLICHPQNPDRSVGLCSVVPWPLSIVPVYVIWIWAGDGYIRHHLAFQSASTSQHTQTFGHRTDILNILSRAMVSVSCYSWRSSRRSKFFCSLDAVKYFRAWWLWSIFIFLSFELIP